MNLIKYSTEDKQYDSFCCWGFDQKKSEFRRGIMLHQETLQKETVRH